MPHQATPVLYAEPYINTLRVMSTDGDGVAHFSVTFATFTQDANTCYPLLGEVLRYSQLSEALTKIIHRYTTFPLS